MENSRLSLGYKSEVPMTPSLGSETWLEWLTELRETFYLIDHWFIIKQYASGWLDGGGA